MSLLKVTANFVLKYLSGAALNWSTGAVECTGTELDRPFDIHSNK